MKNTQNGFVGIVVIILITLAVVGSGAYIYSQNNKVNTENQNITNTGVKFVEKVAQDDIYTDPKSAQIRANVSTMKVWATLYFDKYNSYVGICDSTNEKTKAEGIDKFLESTLKIVSSQDIYCNASVDAFVYSVRLPRGDFWCTDTINLGSAISTKGKTLSCK